jgi:hypothetical protein
VHRAERVDPELRADLVAIARDRWGHLVDLIATWAAPKLPTAALQASSV